MIRFPFGSAPVFAVCLSTLTAAPPVIDDQEILEALTTKAGEMVGKEGIPSADELAKRTRQGPRVKPQIPVPAPSTAPGGDYETLSRSVFLIGSVYNCGKCHKWHQGGTATAWCLAPDGLLVTNAHVFKNTKGGAMAVVDREGRCFPVTDLLGYDIPADVAVFRVKAENLQPLPIAAPAKVGEAVTVISHPQGNHFIRTEGSVARYAKRPAGKDQPKSTWMSITADFAKGSSGGPVFNASGEVVGMVASTRSIYTGAEPGKSKDSPKGDLQMVVRECVPADAIRALIEPEKPQAGN